MNTVIEQIKNAFPFEVIKRPMLNMEKVESMLDHLAYMNTPITRETTELIMDTAKDKNAYRLYRSDTGQAVGNPVSESYQVHTRDDIIALTTTAIESLGTDAQLKMHWNDGHFIAVAPNKDAQIKCAVDNTLFKRIIVNGRYGGLSTLTGVAGLYRHRCTNLMMIQSVQSARMSIRHTANLPNRVNDLLMQFNTLNQSWELSSHKIEKMHRNEVNLGSYIDQVWEIDRDEDKPSTRADNRARAIATRWNNEQENPRPTNHAPHITTNAWEAFNAVQGHIQHNGSQTTHNLARAFKTLDAPRVKRAEVLALA